MLKLFVFLREMSARVYTEISAFAILKLVTRKVYLMLCGLHTDRLNLSRTQCHHESDKNR